MDVTASLLTMLALSLDPQVRPPDTSVTGPAALCFHHSRFILDESERVAEVRMGVHGAVVDVDGPAGRYEVSENEIYALPARRGAVVFRDEAVTIRRFRREGVSYGFFTRPSFSPGRDVMLALVSGEALTGRASDAAVYRRFVMGTPVPEACDHRYLYGWGVMLGEDF